MDTTKIKQEPVNLQELAAKVHDNAVKHGWWENHPSDEHCLMLVISELAEAIEAHRAYRHNFVEIPHIEEAPNSEIWKSVENYEGEYEVSNWGNVRSIGIQAWNGKSLYLKPQRVLKAGVSGTGYRTVSLRGKTHKVAVLVANAFLNKPNSLKKVYVNHIDGNKQNDFVSNLEFTSPTGNNIHAYRTGLRKPVQKLGYAQKCEIAHIHKAGIKYTTILKIKDWGVTRSAIQRVCNEYKRYTDSVEFELADTVIRLLDLAGARGYELSYCINECGITRQRAFTENVWEIVQVVTNSNIPVSVRVILSIEMVDVLANTYGFNLWWYVKKKMEYNISRPYKHGKKY